MAWGRSALVLAVALYLAFLIMRVAFAQSYPGMDASRAAKFWPGHPAVVLESGLAEIGARAVAGKPIDPLLVKPLLAVSARAPLAPEPFLIRGVQAQLAGDRPLALRAFLAARERSPRLIAARYFLADHYLKTGQTGPGLAEISILARLVPQSLPTVVPFLAAFARSPGALPPLKEVLRRHPQLEPVLLETLSVDAGNASLVMALWSGRSDEQAAIWQGRVLTHLVDSGRYELARETWARFTGTAGEPGQLFDPSFSKAALPPFGWSLTSGSAGVADPERGGRLHVLFYGRDDMVLAQQLMMLKPGQYRLSMAVDTATSPPDALEWAVVCLPSSIQVALVPLHRSGSIERAFAIPLTGCGAQRLELRGTVQAIPEQADVTISKFRLQPEAAR